MTDLAILHDQLASRGGAERVACELARTFDAPILAAYVDDGAVPDDVDARQVFDGPVANAVLDSHWVLEDAYQMARWEAPSEVYEYDTIILTKNNPAWTVFEEHQTVVWYAHHTLRSLHDRRPRMGANAVSSVVNKLQRALFRPNVGADLWVTNSDVTRRRLEHYWNIPRDRSRVVYPPVQTHEYGPNDAPTEDVFVTVGRLEENKRVGLLCEAFADLPDQHLIVAGDGSERDRLERDAPDNVTFAGFVSEERKRALLSRARAFLFAGENEDFGIAPVEAMAAGTPVVGVNDGFTQFQVVNKRNGLTFDATPGACADAVRDLICDGVGWTPAEIASFAERFRAERFRAEMRDAVDEARERARITPWTSDRETHTTGETAEERARTDGGGA